jgi:holin-like protein
MILAPDAGIPPGGSIMERLIDASVGAGSDESNDSQFVPSLQGSLGAGRGLPLAFAVLVGCQLAGEVLRQILRLPLPGPLIGMTLLTIALAVRGRRSVAKDPPSALSQAANGLIANMGLLFIPAGVGVVAQMGVLRREWLPILAGLLVSTVLGLAVTGLVMQHVSRLVEARRPQSA